MLLPLTRQCPPSGGRAGATTRTRATPLGPSARQAPHGTRCRTRACSPTSTRAPRHAPPSPPPPPPPASLLLPLPMSLLYTPSVDNSYTPLVPAAPAGADSGAEPGFVFAALSSPLPQPRCSTSSTLAPGYAVPRVTMLRVATRTIVPRAASPSTHGTPRCPWSHYRLPRARCAPGTLCPLQTMSLEPLPPASRPLRPRPLSIANYVISATSYQCMTRGVAGLDTTRTPSLSEDTTRPLRCASPPCSRGGGRWAEHGGGGLIADAACALNAGCVLVH